MELLVSLYKSIFHIFISYHPLSLFLINGTLEKKVLKEDPFRSLGSVTRLFRNDIDDVCGIISVINIINRNTEEFEGV